MLTVKSKTDSVRSITILGVCHLLRKTLIDVFYDIHLPGEILIYVHYYMHLPPFNSVEVLGGSVKIECTVNNKSNSGSSISILGACHILGKTLIDVLYDIHLPPIQFCGGFEKYCVHCQK